MDNSKVRAEINSIVHKLQHSTETGWSARLTPAECRMLLLSLFILGNRHHEMRNSLLDDYLRDNPDATL